MFRMVFPALAVFLASVTGDADMYVWRDARGAMKYSEVSPGGGVRNVRKIKTTVKFQCTFSGSPADCGLHLQAKAQSRASIEKVARDGSAGLRLRTEPGDDNVASSGDIERTDMYLSQADTGCYEGREQWWDTRSCFPMTTYPRRRARSIHPAGMSSSISISAPPDRGKPISMRRSLLSPRTE